MASKVLLVSPHRFLNTALIQVMNEELGLDCELCGLEGLKSQAASHENGRGSSQQLLLLDHLGLDFESLCESVRQFHEGGSFDRRLSAIYNVARDSGIERKAITLGVRGIFYDDYELDLFKKGVASLLEGDIWFPRKVLFDCISEGFSLEHQAGSGNDGSTPLTPREEEILVMISSGKTNAEIAENLYISPSTVKTHVYNIFQKINVPNRIQAALWTVRYFGRMTEH